MLKLSYSQLKLSISSQNAAAPHPFSKMFGQLSANSRHLIQTFWWGGGGEESGSREFMVGVSRTSEKLYPSKTEYWIFSPSNIKDHF